MTIELFLFVTTILLTSLAVGVFYAYSISVNWALHKLDDNGYLQAMQHINRVIQNPLFLSVFLLPVILLPLLTVLYGGFGASLHFWLLGLASVAYIFGMFGITMAGNIPLNNQLDKAALDTMSTSELSAARDHYETPWNRLHTIRTILGIVSLIFLLWGSLL